MSETADLVAFADFVWLRHRTRMSGLADDEWRWLPTTDDDLGLRWRLDHIAQLLSEPRNAQWLGLPADSLDDEPAESAGAALERGERAFDSWRTTLSQLDSAALAADLGPLAGPFAESSRRSFVLHVMDELIHHTAEAALLRDLHAHR